MCHWRRENLILGERPSHLIFQNGSVFSWSSLYYAQTLLRILFYYKFPILNILPIQNNLSSWIIFENETWRKIILDLSCGKIITFDLIDLDFIAQALIQLFSNFKWQSFVKNPKCAFSVFLKELTWKTKIWENLIGFWYNHLKST